MLYFHYNQNKYISNQCIFWSNFKLFKATKTMLTKNVKEKEILEKNTKLLVSFFCKFYVNSKIRFMNGPWFVNHFLCLRGFLGFSLLLLLLKLIKGSLDAWAIYANCCSMRCFSKRQARACSIIVVISSLFVLREGP